MKATSIIMDRIKNPVKCTCEFYHDPQMEFTVRTKKCRLHNNGITMDEYERLNKIKKEITEYVHELTAITDYNISH